VLGTVGGVTRARRFRFGLLVSRAASAADWRELAQKVESLGYATLLVADHFGAQLAPMPALVSAAAATRVLRVGTFVLDNDFRHPAAVAKEAATVDLLTEGRLELGIGAGWNPIDYAKTGLTFEPAATRVAKLEEAMQILQSFFHGGPVSFHGDYYQVNELEAEPRWVQQPRPPILIGAAGRRMLTLAAKHADIVNFPDRPSVGVSTAGNPGLGLTMDQQMAIVRAAAGARYVDLELSSLTIPRLVDDVAGTLDALAAQMRTTPEIVAAMPGTLVGSQQAIVDKLHAMRERYDISYLVVPGQAIDTMAAIVAVLSGT
jgi:probable F420-dependent oxidoreductase